MKLLAAAVILTFALPALAGPTGQSLRRSTPCCWETLFRQGEIGCVPLGYVSGTVLYADGQHPRVKARIQGTVWKGKQFHGDGTFTNRWLGGIYAVSTDTKSELSWLDGQPCLVMQYPPDAPIFGNLRDELRQIAPNVWLGRSFDAATRQPKNWFVLECRRN